MISPTIYIYIYWMLVWMISQVLSIISVLSCPHITIHLENEWAYLLINVDQQDGILGVHIRCLHEWSQLLACYSICHVPIHIENERTYPFINFYRPYGMSYTYWMLVWMISKVLSFTNVLSCPTCPYTHWIRMILPIDQLFSTVCYIKCIYCVSVLMPSPALSWSTFSNRMVC